jgi:hypothetical protein
VGLNSLKSVNLTNVYPNNKNKNKNNNKKKNNKVKSKPLELRSRVKRLQLLEYKQLMKLFNYLIIQLIAYLENTNHHPLYELVYFLPLQEKTLRTHESNNI